MADIIDINVFETVEEVTINATPNVIEVNINKITPGGGGGSQTLAQTLDLGNNTGGNNILLNDADALLLENTSSLKKGTYNFGANGGISRICGVGFEDMWQSGIRHVFDGNGFIRNSTNCFNIIPDNTFDITKRFIVGSIWTLDNSTNYICTFANENEAIWEIYNKIPTQVSELLNDMNYAIDSNYVHTENNYTDTEKTKLAGIAEGATNVTKTSDLINDGDNGISHFISLEDLPSNIVFYPTNVASDVSGYVKIVTSITDPSYNTTAVDISTGAITTTNQLISSLATSPNIIVGNPGVFNITTIGNIRRTSGSGQASFFFRVYKRTLAGVETLVATSDNTIPVIDGGTYVEFSATAIWNDGIFLDTDRVVMKYYANRITGGSNPTYQFQFGGVTPVRTLVPIPLSVVPLISLDGLSDVAIASVANEDFLRYESSTSLWKNAQITASWILSKLGITTLSGSNTGDNATNTQYSGLAASKENTANKQNSLSLDGTGVKFPTVDAVNTALALKLDKNLFSNFIISTPSTYVTGTLTETQVLKLEIPANTFKTDDVFKIPSAMFSRIGVNNTFIIKAKLSTSSTMPSGSTSRILEIGVSAANTFTNLYRTFYINAGNIKGSFFGNAFTSDIASNNLGMSSAAFDVTVTQYLYFSITLANVADQVRLEGLQLTNN